MEKKSEIKENVEKKKKNKIIFKSFNYIQSII